MACKNSTSDWNPMEEAFNDHSFNTYIEGPGSHMDLELQPCYSRRMEQPRKAIKLHVANLPTDFSEEGIENLFRAIGVEPLEVFRYQPQSGAQTTWAFVHFDSKRKAQYVIQELDRQSPFYLRIQYAHSDSEKERDRLEREKNELWQSALKTDTLMIPEVPVRRSTGMGRGSLPVPSRRPGVVGNMVLRDDEYDYDEFNDDSEFYHSYTGGNYDDSNKYIMKRLSITLKSSNGVRQVVLGRGFTPNRKREQQKFKSAGSSERNPGTMNFQFGEMPPEAQSLRAPCVVCHRLTTSCCAKCRESYCSRTCQIQDSSSHCHKMCMSLLGLSEGSQTFSPRKEEIPKILSLNSEINESRKFGNKDLHQLPIGTSSFTEEVSYKSTGSENDINVGGDTSKLEETPVSSTKQIKLNEFERCQRPNPVYNVMDMKVKGYCQFRKLLNPNQFTVNLVAPGVISLFQRLINMQEVCASLPSDNSFRAAVGDIVAAKSLCDEWHRARVMVVADNSYRVHYLDLGFTEKVTCITKLPEEFMSIPEFAAEATVVEFCKPEEIVKSQHFKPDAKFSFELVEKFEDAALIHLKSSPQDEELMCSVKLSKYSPMLEEAGFKCLQLANGSKVIISNISNSNTLHLKPTDEKLGLKSAKTLQLVATHCLSAKPLDHAPRKGEIVACKYNLDGNYYRAQVRSIINENITVSFIDFGNDSIVKKDDLLTLSEELKEIPATAVMVHLNGISDEPLTNDAALFIQELIAQETEMKLIFSSMPADAVDLYLPDGSHLNKKMEDLLKPSWKKPNSTTDEIDIFMYNDLPENQLPLESMVNLLIYHYKEGIVAGIVLDEDITVALDSLNNKVAEYCNSTTSQNFLPRINELLFAIYQGGWYRAVCTEVSQNVVEVYFIDYGNTEIVPLTDIRKMVPEFMSIPATAFIGKLQGCGDNFTEDLEEKMRSIIQISTPYEGKIFGKSKGEYVIDIPTIREAIAAVA